MHAIICSYSSAVTRWSILGRKEQGLMNSLWILCQRNPAVMRTSLFIHQHGVQTVKKYFEVPNSFLFLVYIVLTRFLHELDERVKEMSADVKQKRKIPDRKTRILGAPLSSFPPDRPPKWTISKDWIKGKHTMCFCHCVPDLSFPFFSLSLLLFPLPHSPPLSVSPSLSLPLVPSLFVSIVYRSSRDLFQG